MREYQLLDADYALLVSLNGILIEEPARKSLTLGNDSFIFESHIIEKSSLDGAVKIGEARIKSKEAILRFDRAAGTDDTDLRAKENILIRYFLDAFYLYDVESTLRIPIAILSYTLDYDPGAFQLSSSNEIELRFLDPCWESSTITNYTDSLTIDLNEIEIVNNNFLKCYPVLTFTAAGAVTILKIYVDETKEGLMIEDPLFGTGTYTTLIIDCKNGTIELSGLDRTIYISPGTGYFPFPIGTSHLKILPSAICDVDVDFYQRYFI